LRFINLKLIVLSIFISYSFTQDTTYVDVPTAYVHFGYENSTYGIGLGDESSLQLISSLTWTDVFFNLDTGNWLTYVEITGEPGLVHEGVNELTVGWYEWNYDTGEEELWHVYVFTIPVEYPVCEDPDSCNFDPSMPEVENCLYEVMCYIDPCEVTTCEYYPEAECVADYCGGCFADFYVDDQLVDCAIPPEDDVFFTWEYPDTVAAGSTENMMALSLENSMSVAGLQFQIAIEPTEAAFFTQIENTDRTQNFMCSWNYNEFTELYTFVMFDFLSYVSPGEGPILEFYFDTESYDGNFQIILQNMLAADMNGYLLNSSLPDPPIITIDPCLPGDVNGDQEINILDIVATVNCIIENIEDECPCSDMNDDGEVNILDVVLMVNMIIEGSNQTEILNIRYGSAWSCVFAIEGWCYCEHAFDISESDVSMTAISWCGDPDITTTGTISSVDWDELLSLVDRDYFLSLDDAYGSMGGDDSNYEWITIEFEDVTKMVGFTYSLDMWEELSGLESLRDYLVSLSTPYYNEIRCNAEPDIGPCDGACPRYFYNPQTEQCEMFSWGCCNGVVPFETMEECVEMCE